MLVAVTLMWAPLFCADSTGFFQDGQAPHLPITTFVTRKAHTGVLHGDAGIQDSGMPCAKQMARPRCQRRLQGDTAPVSREVNLNPLVLMGLFFFPIRPPAPPVEKCSFWKRSSPEPSGSSSNSTCCARTASQPSSAPSPSTSSAARPLLSVALPDRVWPSWAGHLR